MSEVYETREYKVEDGAGVIEKTVANPAFRSFGDEEVREKAKGLFVERFEEMAGRMGWQGRRLGFTWELREGAWGTDGFGYIVVKLRLANMGRSTGVSRLRSQPKMQPGSHSRPNET